VASKARIFNGGHMILFDSHCHLYDDKYEGNTDEIIKNAHENDVLYMTNIGTDEETSKLVAKQAIKYEGVYCAIGMYPEFCNDDEVDLSFIEELVESEKSDKTGQPFLSDRKSKEEK
jgi:TatD DNase family protein